MKYYDLRFESGKYYDDGIKALCDNKELDLNLVYRGNPVDEKEWNKNGDVTFSYDPTDGQRIATDYLDNDMGWLIVSDKFVDLTKELIKDEVQYLSVKIFNKKNGNELKGYQIINVINVIDGLDLENSACLTHYENYYNVLKYALKDDVCNGNNMFMIDIGKDGNYFPAFRRFVSQELVKKVKKHKLTGFRFEQTL